MIFFDFHGFPLISKGFQRFCMRFQLMFIGFI